MRTSFLFLLTVLAAALASAQPAIRSSSGVLNATGYQATLAPDTVFVIFGSGLGPASIQTASAPNYPGSLGGTSVTFTPVGGGAPVAAKMVYTLATQVAGILPSSIAPGTYAVSVMYQTQSSPPQNVTVVARSLGIATSNGAGSGEAQATIGNVNNGISLVRLTGGSISYGGFDYTLSPAHPGDEVVLWGTGGGADPANDTGGSSGDQTAAGNFTVSVDGASIIPLYSGTSTDYPGLWQVNFVVPSNITPDCFASLTVTGGGQTSNPVTIAIAAPGQASCSAAIPASTLAKLDSGTGNITMAGLVLGQNIINGAVSYEIGGVINQYTAAEFLIPYSPKIDKCTVLHEVYPTGGKEPSAPDLTLDAGTLSLSGPNTSLTLTKSAVPLGTFYGGSISSITPGGTYTLSATGGSQVGPFTAAATFPNSFTVTNLSSLTIVNRAQPLTVNWTGSGFDTVEVQINTTTETSTTVNGLALNCAVPASLGTYTIPAAALAYLTPGSVQMQVSADNTNGFAVSAESTTDPNTVIPLVSGGLVDFGGFATYIDYVISVIVQ